MSSIIKIEALVIDVVVHILSACWRALSLSDRLHLFFSGAAFMHTVYALSGLSCQFELHNKQVKQKRPAMAAEKIIIVIMFGVNCANVKRSEMAPRKRSFNARFTCFCSKEMLGR